MHRSIQQARGCACSTLLGKVIARADLEIAPSSVMGGGDWKKGQPESKNHQFSREIESKCNKNSVQEEKYAILSSETLFPSADFVTTTPNLQSKLTICLLYVSHHSFQDQYTLVVAPSQASFPAIQLENGQQNGKFFTVASAPFFCKRSPPPHYCTLVLSFTHSHVYTLTR